MNNKQKGFAIPLIITVVALIVILGGVYIYEKNKSENSSPIACTMEAKLCPDGSYVGRTGPKCEFTACPTSTTSPKQVEFGKPITMFIEDKVSFPDGLSLTLKEINDSRCKPGLQCIWAGELSALFGANIKDLVEEIRLGTTINKEVTLKGYIFSLEDATENSVTIFVHYFIKK